MTEVTFQIGKPQWYKLDDWNGYHWVRGCSIKGLSSGWSHLEKWARIDVGIASLVVLLNQNKMPTQWCCSGLEEDHKSGTSGPIDLVRQGYLYLDCSWASVAALIPECMYLDGDSTIRFHKVSNEARRSAWGQLEERLNKHFRVIA